MTSLALNSDQTGVISVDSDGMMVMSDIFGPNKNREEFKLEIRCKYVKHQLSYPVALTEDAELSDLSLLAKPNCVPGQGPIKKLKKLDKENLSSNGQTQIRRHDFHQILSKI